MPNVLSLGPAAGPGETDVSATLLSPEDASSMAVLGITYTRTATAWAREYRRHVGPLNERLAVVSVGEETRSTTASVSGGPERSNGPDVTAVSDPRDLTELLVRVGDRLAEWADTDGIGRVVLCFDSVTALLQYVDHGTAYRFLHKLTRQTDAVGVVGHYRLAAAAHDDQVIEALMPLFDAVVEPTVDDGLSVRSRKGDPVREALLPNVHSGEAEKEAPE